MSNQVTMTFEEAINYDKAFVLDRLNECLALLKFQLQRCLDGFPSNAYLCVKASESFYKFFRYVDADNGFSDLERTELFDRYFDLKDALKDLKNADQPTVRQADDSAAQPVAPTQLPMFGVLVEITKANPISQSISTLHGKVFVSTGIAGLSPKRGGFTSATTQLLSNTRPVGGLA